jgi:hypothetical protein
MMFDLFVLLLLASFSGFVCAFCFGVVDVSLDVDPSIFIEPFDLTEWTVSVSWSRGLGDGVIRSLVRVSRVLISTSTSLSRSPSVDSVGSPSGNSQDESDTVVSEPASSVTHYVPPPYITEAIEEERSRLRRMFDRDQIRQQIESAREVARRLYPIDDEEAVIRRRREEQQAEYDRDTAEWLQGTDLADASIIDFHFL